jgi:hypothetical protein
MAKNPVRLRLTVKQSIRLIVKRDQAHNLIGIEENATVQGS